MRVEALGDDRPKAADGHGPKRGDVQVNADGCPLGPPREERPFADEEHSAQAQCSGHDTSRASAGEGSGDHEDAKDREDGGATHHQRQALRAEERKKQGVAAGFGGDLLSDQDHSGAGRPRGCAPVALHHRIHKLKCSGFLTGSRHLRQSLGYSAWGWHAKQENPSPVSASKVSAPRRRSMAGTTRLNIKRSISG